MSITYNTYVGPYVRCAVERVKVVRQRRGCTNTTCKDWGEERHGKGAFCIRCGSPIGTVSYDVLESAVSRWDISEEIDQRFSSPGGDGYFRWTEENKAHLWKPNVATPWRDCHLEEREDFALSEIQAIDVTAQRNLFTQFFQAELAVLRKRYGEAAVSIHWGIIQDYY